jgi:hypothetical protein
MPWWGWIIVGVVAWFVFLYTMIFIVWFKLLKQIKKGW